MREINLSASELVNALLSLDDDAGLCLLDSATATHGNSYQLIAGIFPVETYRVENENAEETLRFLGSKFAQHQNCAAIFTISYDFGLKIENITTRHRGMEGFPEPDIFIAFFKNLIVHDYSSEKTFIASNKSSDQEVAQKLFDNSELRTLDSELGDSAPRTLNSETSTVTSNFTKTAYLKTIARAKEFIQHGDAYQINLTHQLKAELPDDLTPADIFSRLREKHPAPFSALINRGEDTVISASPERFLRIENEDGKRIITVSPIKGTRPRGKTPEEDAALRNELVTSKKDRAENVMIVDLLRNDIGRVCEFGTVRATEICAVEEHPSLFHLVSTIRGELREDISFSDLLRATFPCGSITGAPKIRTMQLIDQLEPDARGLSMGAIGYIDFDGTIDMSVAIRTMVVRDGKAIFNVGGGIVTDSVPENEYEETLVKARALMSAINGKLVP